MSDALEHAELMAFMETTNNSCAMPLTEIDGSREYEGDLGDQFLGYQEIAYMWRHPELRGVELFRGVYTTYQAARHFHHGPALGIVANGAMSSYPRGTTHTLSTGTVFLINPGEVHAPRPVVRQGWKLRAFYFSNDLYAKLSSSLGQESFRFSELFVNNVKLTRRLLSLHRELERSSSSLELQSNLLSILGDLAQHYSLAPVIVESQKPQHRKIDRAKEFLDDNYQRVITLEELAKVVELSPYHFLRTFRSAVGITPHEYLTQVRVERARQLLRLGAAIADVAADTGFVDQAHFTRRFKGIMGVTPKRYLQEGRKLGPR